MADITAFNKSTFEPIFTVRLKLTWSLKGIPRERESKIRSFAYARYLVVPRRFAYALLFLFHGEFVILYDDRMELE